MLRHGALPDPCVAEMAGALQQLLGSRGHVADGGEARRRGPLRQAAPQQGGRDSGSAHPGAGGAAPARL